MFCFILGTLASKWTAISALALASGGGTVAAWLTAEGVVLLVLRQAVEGERFMKDMTPYTLRGAM